MNIYEAAAGYAERIEKELRNLDGWQQEPLPDAAYESEHAFFLDTMTLYQWLQFVLVPRVKEIVDERGSFPAESNVGAHAVRELDGVDEAADLIHVLIEFDEFIEGLHRGSRRASRRRNVRSIHIVQRGNAKLAPSASPAPPPRLLETPIESPLVVTERYWRTRDPALLNSSPRGRPGMDVQLAERVFETATGFVEFVGEPQEVADGLLVTTVIQAERGAWVIGSVLCKDQGKWRVDIPSSLLHTTMRFLRQHQFHAPYTERDDARGRAMQFWQHISQRNDRFASELVTPELSEIPHFGEGQMDEFFWYLGHTEEDETATVRVLMNNHFECRTWLTRMVQRGGAWFVNLPGTLAG